MIATWIWVLIPITAIAMSGFEKWLKFQKETRQSTSELDTAVAELSRQLAASRERESQVVERLENLETLVTSRMWHVVQDDPVPQSRPEAIRPETRTGPPPPPPAADPAREAELARARLSMRPAPGERPPSEPDPREKARRMAQKLGV